MIYVTQGHEKSIAIETFIKSLFLLPERSFTNITYVINLEVLKKNIELLNIPVKINNTSIEISNKKIVKCHFFHSTVEQSSLKSIECAIQLLRAGDILVTAPTSKEKFSINKNTYAGHTEYLRNLYSDTITMNFINDNEQILLLTDHIALKNVASNLSLESLVNQVSISLSNLLYYFNRDIDKVLISGINPHAGENGLIGVEDTLIADGCNILSGKFPKIKFHGPIPADTLGNKVRDSLKCLQVFCFHDQGLPYFKFKNGLIGLNTTFGLNFLRLSVDHGTAKELYGLNKANPLGSYYVLKNALKINEEKKY